MSVAQRSISAVLWGTFGSIVKIGLQLISQIILARLLGPAEYGVFAIGLIVISFSNFFSDIGIAYGLIQKSEISSLDLRFVFTIQIIIGLIATAAIFISAPTVADFFHEPRVTPVLQALSFACLFNAAAAPSTNILKRELNYRALQLAQVASYVIGYVFIGIPMALLGYAVWSLVAAWLAQSVANFIMLYIQSRHSVKPLFWYKDAKSLSGYGITVFATNMTNWVIGNIDRVVVGKVMNSATVGLYSTPYNFINNPTITVLASLQSVFFSTCAKLQNNYEKMAQAFLMLLGAIALFLLPVFAGISCASHSIILALYGHKWIAAAPVLQAMAIAMPIYLAWGISTPLLWNTGHAGMEFRLQIPIALLWGIATYIAAQYSITAVGWTVAVLFVLRMSCMLYMVCRILEIRWRIIAQACVAGVILTLSTVLMILITEYFLFNQNDLPIYKLLADVMAGAIGYLTGLPMARKYIRPELLELVRKLAARLPGRIGNVIANLFFYPVKS